MSNLPPGVTGNEYQIAGPDREWDEYRECESEGFTVLTITLYGKSRIEEAIALMNDGSYGPAVVAYLRAALSDMESVDVEGKCPFAGDVTLQTYNGIETWECPLCRETHEKEID